MLCFPARRGQAAPPETHHTMGVQKASHSGKQNKQPSDMLGAALEALWPGPQERGGQSLLRGVQLLV